MKNNKTTKGRKTSKKTATKKTGIKLPTGITENPSGTYRVRKTTGGVTFDASFKKLSDAKAILGGLS